MSLQREMPIQTHAILEEVLRSAVQPSILPQKVKSRQVGPVEPWRAAEIVTGRAEAPGESVRVLQPRKIDRSTE